MVFEVLWLISAEDCASSAVGLLEDKNYSACIFYGSKDQEVWANFASIFSNILQIHSIVIKNNLMLAELASLILDIVPKDKRIVVYDNFWLAEMLAALLDYPVVNDLASELKTPAVISVKASKRYKYNFFDKIDCSKVVTHELICSGSDNLLSACNFVCLSELS